MKLPVRTLLFCTLISLAACESGDAPERKSATPAATVDPASVPVDPAAGKTAGTPLDSGQYLVDLSDGAVSIRANRVDELALFEGVAEAAGFALLTGEIDWKVVSVEIHAETLHAAVVELVKAYPYEIVYAPVEGSREEVLSEVVIGEPLLTAAPDSKPAAAAADDLPAIAAIKALPEHERQQAYLQELQNSSAEIRAASAKEIKPVGDAVNRLADMIVNDPSPEVRIATTWSLETADEPERQQALDALVQCLADKDFNVVAECIRSLAFLADESSVVHLQPLLTHQDETVRNEAFEAIKWIQ
jgi:hypothetical protein